MYVLQLLQDAVDATNHIKLMNIKLLRITNQVANWKEVNE